MISFILQGRTPSKKNNKRVVTNRSTGKPMIISSFDFMVWQNEAIVSLMAQHVPRQEIQCCKINFHFTMGDKKRTDIDNKISSILDMLVKYRTIAGDHWQVVRELKATADFQKDFWSCKVMIEEIEE